MKYVTQGPRTLVRVTVCLAPRGLKVLMRVTVTVCVPLEDKSSVTKHPQRGRCLGWAVPGLGLREGGLTPRPWTREAGHSWS